MPATSDDIFGNIDPVLLSQSSSPPIEAQNVASATCQMPALNLKRSISVAGVVAPDQTCTMASNCDPVEMEDLTTLDYGKPQDLVHKSSLDLCTASGMCQQYS